MQIYHWIWYFFIYGMLGWCAEVAFAAVKERKFVNRGFLNGPICPVYGVGVGVVVQFLDGLEENLLLLYIASTVLVTLIEWLTGYLMDRIFHHKWWDYSEQPLNIGGYVCLPFSLVWGVACVLIVKVIHPPVEHLVGWIPEAAGIVLLILLLAGFCADVCVTTLRVLKMNHHLDAMEKIAAELRELSDKMGENIYENVMETIEFGQEQLERGAEQKERLLRLKEKYAELSKRSARLSRHFVKAFPKMQSRKHRELLNEIRQNLRKGRR